MKIIKLFLTIYFFILFTPSISADNSFEKWLINFKIKAQEEGISKKTINNVISINIIEIFLYILKFTNNQKNDRWII